MAEDDSWDESSDGAAAPAVKEPQQPPKFDDSESDEEPPPQQQQTQQTQQQSTQQSTQQQQTTDDSKNQTETSQTQNQSQKPQNNQKNKTNKPKPARQVSQSKSSKNKNNKNKNTNNNEDDSSTTSDSSDEDTGQQPNAKKMQSYDERNTEDNVILFGSKYRGGGRGGRGRGRGGGGRGGGGRGGVQEDNRVMLSGDVRLQSFPLGSQQDCIKLAKEVSALMNGKRYEGDINSMDIIKFVSYVIDGLVSKNINHMDIVDINEIKVQIDKIYNRKQKDMRSHKKKKKPIHRFGKKYSAGPVGNTSTNAPNQGGKHIDGQYNENDFDFLN